MDVENLKVCLANLFGISKENSQRIPCICLCFGQSLLSVKEKYIILFEQRFVFQDYSVSLLSVSDVSGRMPAAEVHRRCLFDFIW
jgi:hypothetical protein